MRWPAPSSNVTFTGTPRAELPMANSGAANTTASSPPSRVPAKAHPKSLAVGARHARARERGFGPMHLLFDVAPEAHGDEAVPSRKAAHRGRRLGGRPALRQEQRQEQGGNHAPVASPASERATSRFLARVPWPRPIARMRCRTTVRSSTPPINRKGAASGEGPYRPRGRRAKCCRRRRRMPATPPPASRRRVRC